MMTMYYGPHGSGNMDLQIRRQPFGPILHMCERCEVALLVQKTVEIISHTSMNSDPVTSVWGGGGELW